MVLLIPILHAGEHLGSNIALAIGLLASVSACVALCAKHARRVSRKYEAEKSDANMVPRSPLRSVPKQLITTISNKAIPFIYHRNAAGDDLGTDRQSKNDDEGEEGLEEDGLWQKTILMGEKCQPPEFSGVIYYDNCGNQIPELPPRSPRAAYLPSFSFPAAREAN